MPAPPTSPGDRLVCPSCRQTFDGGPSACPNCGGDLRGLGATNETLSGEGRARAGSSSGVVVAGTVIDRRYRVIERLGEGGMGSVYKVEHVKMGKLVALKLLRPESALDRSAIKRFRQEAQIVSRLSHPNTVSVFDFGELPDGALFMAMEFVPGRDLSRVLEAEGALSEKRAVSLTIQVLRSLAEAHDAGIVHRDVKPANVMVLRTREGDDFVKLLDFGIAKLVAVAAARSSGKHQTGAGDFVGTPLYMSPEQVSGEPTDPRSDLYSVGAMLAELLTGKPLFDGPTPMAIAAKHLKEKPPSLREAAPHLGISEGVEAVVQRALAKEPANRFANADQMRAALGATRDSVALPNFTTGDWEKVRTGELAIARRDDWDLFESSLRWRRRLTPLIASLALLGLAGGSYALYRSRQQVEPPRMPVTVEVEPNDGPRTANLIAPGTDVQGFIKRASRDKSDRDLFEFSVPGPDPLHADISVSGVPNVNLAMDLFGYPEGDTEEGERLPNLAHVDDRFLGGGEQMTDLKLAPGRYLLRLEDRRRPDETPGAPRENTLDPYTVRVDLAPLPSYFEEEPDNVLEQAMRLSAARPVFGHAGARGEASQVKTASGETAAVAGLWSDDYYELVLPKGATTGCAVLTGVSGAVLSLSVVATDKAKIDEIADPVERDRALREHLAKMLQDKPVRVAEDDVEKKCAHSGGSVVFKIAVAEGGSAQRYVLVPVDDSDDGFAAALSACDELSKTGERALCGKILTKAIAALPVSKSVESAKLRLHSLSGP